jgi:hypothetical protein
VYILMMATNGTVKSHTVISGTSGNFSKTLEDNDQFGWAIAPLGDVSCVRAPSLCVLLTCCACSISSTLTASRMWRLAPWGTLTEGRGAALFTCCT